MVFFKLLTSRCNPAQSKGSSRNAKNTPPTGTYAKPQQLPEKLVRLDPVTGDGSVVCKRISDGSASCLSVAQRTVVRPRLPVRQRKCRHPKTSVDFQSTLSTSPNREGETFVPVMAVATTVPGRSCVAMAARPAAPAGSGRIPSVVNAVRIDVSISESSTTTMSSTSKRIRSTDAVIGAVIATPSAKVSAFSAHGVESPRQEVTMFAAPFAHTPTMWVCGECSLIHLATPVINDPSPTGSTTVSISPAADNST